MKTIFNLDIPKYSDKRLTVYSEKQNRFVNLFFKNGTIPVNILNFKDFKIVKGWLTNNKGKIIVEPGRKSGNYIITKRF